MSDESFYRDVANAQRERAEAAERELAEARAEIATERSRFAFAADQFGDLAYELERRAGSDWGHLRHRVLAELRGVVKRFREYAAGQLSPSNWRRRAEEAERQLATERQESAVRQQIIENVVYAIEEESLPHPALAGNSIVVRAMRRLVTERQERQRLKDYVVTFVHKIRAEAIRLQRQYKQTSAAAVQEAFERYAVDYRPMEIANHETALATERERIRALIEKWRWRTERGSVRDTSKRFRC